MFEKKLENFPKSHRNSRFSSKFRPKLKFSFDFDFKGMNKHKDDKDKGMTGHTISAKYPRVGNEWQNPLHDWY